MKQERDQMIFKRLDEISVEDIQFLINDEVKESISLDYKEDAPSNSESFLKDFVSMANAEGGIIIYGVSEKKDANGNNTDLPEKAFLLEDRVVVGLENRLSNYIRNSIEPRVSTFGFKTIQGPEGGSVAILRVPKAWNGPIAQRIGDGNFKFFTRTASQNNPMNLQMLGEAFGRAGEIRTRLSEFRFQRLSGLMEEGRPFPLFNKSIVVIHLVPLEALTNSQWVDFNETSCDHFSRLDGFWGVQESYNFDGKAFWHGGDENSVNNYIQTFRNGTIEAATLSFFNENPSQKIFGLHHFEDCLLKAIPIFVETQRKLGLMSPIALMINILGVRGARLEPRKFYYLGHNAQIRDRNDLILPERLLLSVDNVARDLHFLFDMVANAFGLSRTPTYDKNGNRKE